MIADEPSEGVGADTLIAQRYRVVRKLGTGGMGAVYLVQHIHTDERFALKVLLSTVIKDTNALDRFRREARTPARIDSDHVVRVTDADVAPELKGAPFLVMEYLRGEDLDGYLGKMGAIPPRDVVSFLKQIARALDKAHALGIVHRDLKPENIFITQREDGTAHIKILDFGIAKFTHGAAMDLASHASTSPGEIFGTPLYMSPEQARAENTSLTRQADLWALGLIAHRMLTNQEYWSAETLTALIAQIVYEPMKAPSQRGFDFGPSYDEWFLKSCAREPKERYESAGAQVLALAHALGLDAEMTYPDAAPSLSGIPRPTPSSPSTATKQSDGARISADVTKALSKTDLQLATTGVATARPESTAWPKVAIPALVAGLGLGALLYVFVLKEPAQTGPISGKHVAASDVTREPTAPPTTEASAASPTAQVTPSALPFAAPSTSASAPVASAAPTPSNTVPRPSILPRPGKLPTATAVAPPVVTAPPPAKPPDPLDSRN